MDENSRPVDALDLLVAQAKRMQRESRILVQQAARLRDSMNDTAQEGTDDERHPEDAS